MPGLISSGWQLTDVGSLATSMGEGVVVGGGQYTLELQDGRGQKSKLCRFGAGAGSIISPR